MRTINQMELINEYKDYPHKEIANSTPNSMNIEKEMDYNEK